MKKYYAAENHYGSENSIGGYNTWFVLAFDSRQHRDEWVDNQKTLSARAIRRDEAIRYQRQGGSSKEPIPFTDQYWGFRPYWEYSDKQPIGYIGHLTVCDSNWEQGERFYK